MINSTKNKNIEIQSGFEKIFVNPNLLDSKILSILESFKLNYKSLSVDKIEILDKILHNYKKITNGSKKNNNIFFFNEYDKLEISKFINDEGKLLRYFIYRYKYKTYPVNKVTDQYPPCVQIEPTSVCNFRCIMCYQKDKSFSDKKNNFMGFMKLELFKKIIDELEGKVEAITFASRGEPTLNKKFVEFLKYCKEKFVAIKINTNLFTMTEDLAKAIFENDVQTLVVSADDAEKENYEKIRVKGKFEKLLTNLEMLYNVKKKYPKTRTIVRVSGVKINKKQDFNKMKKVYGKYTDSVAFVNYLPWESSYENEINDIQEPCTDLWKRIFIWYDGKINPCDYDYKSLLSKHNVRETSVRDCWTSDYYNDLRKRHINRERKGLVPCNSCTNI
jgi:MoaA/NifB/PqqE/SkfB family radical SAM enzyme